MAVKIRGGLAEKRKRGEKVGVVFLFFVFFGE